MSCLVMSNVDARFVAKRFVSLKCSRVSSLGLKFLFVVEYDGK